MGIPTIVPYVAGDDVTAEGQNNNEASLAAEIVNIQAVNVPSGAAIPGDRLASKPNGVSTAQINAKAVTSVELANDAVVDASRAVSADHIKNNAIIGRTVKIATYSWAPVATINANASISDNTGLGSTIKPLSVYKEGSGAVQNLCSRLVLSLWWDTGGSVWRLYLSNENAVNIDPTGLTIRFTYIEA